MFDDEFLPTYDVSDAVAGVVHADPATAYGVGSGAHVLVGGPLDAARADAEERSGRA